MQELLNNTVFVYGAMSVIIFALTQGLKWAFIKPWTNKITNERARKAVNTTIYLIPYALGILFEYLYGVMLMQGEFNAVMGIIHGTSGIACYGVFERIYALVTGKSSNIENPYENTEEGKAVKELMSRIAEDGKVNADDHPALAEFLKKVK
jgi:hypothetical protein